jgi:eight-cysteine-cluster-containing protein
MVFRILILAISLGVPATYTAAPEVDSLASTSSFYTIRRDVRRCASPMCGGYFIRLVNQSRMRCANGRFMRECYVATIEWNGQPETDKDGALVRGSLSTRGDRRGRFGIFFAREVWLPAGNSQPSGIYYRVRDRGIRCVAAPCETHHEAQLNSTMHRNIAGVDLAPAGAPENVASEALAAMTAPDGVLVAGVHTRVTGPAGRSLMLKASQFYLRGKPGGTSSDNQNKPCFKTGCSGQVCADEEVVTTCEWRTEYECYKTAKCERQANGKCGFTDTPELRRCLRRN